MLRKSLLAATVLSCSLLFPSHTARSTLEKRVTTETAALWQPAQKKSMLVVGHHPKTTTNVVYSQDIPPASDEYCQGTYEDFNETKTTIDTFFEQFTEHPQQAPYILADNDRERIRSLWTNLVDTYQALQQNCSVWTEEHHYSGTIELYFKQLSAQVRKKAKQGYQDVYITTLIAEENYSEARKEAVNYVHACAARNLFIAPLQQIFIAVLNAEKTAMRNQEEFDAILHDVSEDLLQKHKKHTKALTYDILLNGYSAYNVAINLLLEHREYMQAYNMAIYVRDIGVLKDEQFLAIKKLARVE